MKNIENNCEALRRQLPRDCALLLHTNPRSWHNYYHKEFNAVLRLVGKRKGIAVVDWDSMLSHITNRNSIFSDDGIHPVQPHTAGFAVTAVKFSTFIATHSNSSFWGEGMDAGGGV